MRGKLLFIAGIGLGYVLGARAGRGAFEKIKNRAEDVWTDPNVQKGVHNAGEFVKDKAPVVGGKLKDAAASATSAVKDKVGSGDVADKVDAAGDKVQDAVGHATDAASDAADTAAAKAREASSDGK